MIQRFFMHRKHSIRERSFFSLMKEIDQFLKEGPVHFDLGNNTSNDHVLRS